MPSALLQLFKITDLHCLGMQEALQHEPKFRRIMDGGSAAPSQQLISEWNKHSVSDAVVLFLRAVTAVHILKHPGFHQDNYMVDMADIKG